MVLVNQENPYIASSLQESSSNNHSSQPFSDSPSVSSTGNNIAQRHDKGKQKAVLNTAYNSYYHYHFPITSLSLAASTSKSGPETGVMGPESILHHQVLTSGSSTTASMSRNIKRKEKVASNFMVMHMSQCQSINVKKGFGMAKKQREKPMVSVDPNLNLAIPGLPKGKNFDTEAAQRDEKERTCVLSYNQLNRPISISSSIHLNSLQLSASAPDIGSTYSTSPTYNLFSNASTSLEFSNESQAKFLLPMEADFRFFGLNTFLHNTSLNRYENDLNMSQDINLWASNANSTCPSSAVENKTNHMNQLSADRANTEIARLTLNRLVPPSFGKTHSSGDQLPPKQLNWERSLQGSDSVAAPQINYQPEFATENLLTQNPPNNFDVALWPNSEAQNTPVPWPSHPNGFFAPFNYKDPNLKVTQTEQFCSNYTQKIPQIMLTMQTPWTPINTYLDGSEGTPSSVSIESFSDKLEPALEENSISDDVMLVDPKGCFDPPLEYKGPKFPDDLYTPHWIRIENNKRLGRCEHCYNESGNWWFFQIKCSAYRYHLNTSHGICTSGKRFADPLDKRTLADGSVEFLCHECYKYKHIHRYAQDDIHTWYRHAAQCHSSNRRANAHGYYKPKRL